MLAPRCRLYGGTVLHQTGSVKFRTTGEKDLAEAICRRSSAGPAGSFAFASLTVVTEQLTNKFEFEFPPQELILIAVRQLVCGSGVSDLVSDALVSVTGDDKPRWTMRRLMHWKTSTKIVLYSRQATTESRTAVRNVSRPRPLGAGAKAGR